MTINAPKNILAPEHKHLFDQLNAAEQLALICREKTDKENLLAAAKVETAARASALKKAADSVMKPLKAEIEALNDRAAEIVEANRKVLMGKKKTLEMAGQVIAFRTRPVVEIDDEDKALEELQDMMNDSEADDSDRVSAQACLRFGKVTLNKEFMREAAKKCGAWLAGFGIRVKRAETLSINLKGTEEGGES